MTARLAVTALSAFPALPFAFETGPAAVAESAVTCVLVAITIAFLLPRRDTGQGDST